MEINYALIRGNKVENIIVADDDFIKLISHEWDAVEKITGNTDLNVGIGWSYENGTFVAPVLNEIVEE